MPDHEGELAAAALEYARRGWSVVPLHTMNGTRCTCNRDDCRSPGKHPRTEHGLSDASSNPEQVAAWWRQWPNANIGLLTGVVFDVLDLDGATGIATFKAALDEQNATVDTGPRTNTGGGGMHVLFQATGARNRVGFLPKVDWRGTGGYIVAPPSLHASGRRYEWRSDPTLPLPEADQWLLDLVDPPHNNNTVGVAKPPPTGLEDGTPYGLQALERELAELRRAAPGTRNHTLNACAFSLYQLVAGGELKENVVEYQLRATAASIGLSDHETDQTIKSGRAAGLQRPRNAPELKMLHGGRGVTVNHEPEPEDEPAGESLLFYDWTPAELLDADTGFTWLAEGMYAQPTYGMTAGESKTAKTTIGVITQMSIAAGIDVFGRFKVPKPRAVIVYVGEGGRIPHTRLLSRVAEAMGIDWRDLPIYPRHEIAAINSTRFQLTLMRDLEKYEPGLVVIDPYYAFHGSKADSKNLHEEAEVLNGASSRCVEAGAVLDITNHFNRNEGKGLRRITMAGGAEWVDTWRLVEHREPPNIDTGRLELRLEIGSRQWGGSSWDIDLNLGRFLPELGIYDGPISWAIRRPGAQSNDPRVDRIMQAVEAAPFTLTKDELAKIVGGKATESRGLVDFLEQAKKLRGELVDRADKKGRNYKVWAYGPTHRPEAGPQTPPDHEGDQ